MKKSKRIKLLELAIEAQERNYSRLVMHLMEHKVIPRDFDMRIASRLSLKEWADEDIKFETIDRLEASVPIDFGVRRNVKP